MSLNSSKRKLFQKIFIGLNVAQINDKSGSTEITGTIDFSDETKPKVRLVNGAGNTYISNISEKGKKYTSNIYQRFG